MTDAINSKLSQQYEGTRLAVAAYAAQDIKALLASNPSQQDLSAGLCSALVKQGFSVDQANSFVAKYTPAAALDQDGAGAVLFRVNGTNEVATAVRGTEYQTREQITNDLVLADGTIALGELPVYQTTLIANFVLRETTPAGQAVAQFSVQGINSNADDLVRATADTLANAGGEKGSATNLVTMPALVQTGTAMGTGRAVGPCVDASAHSEGSPEVTTIGSAIAQCSRITTVNGPGVSVGQMQSVADQVTQATGLPSQDLSSQNQLNIHTTGVSIIDRLNGGLVGDDTLLTIPTSYDGLVGSHSSIVAMNAAEAQYKASLGEGVTDYGVIEVTAPRESKSESSLDESNEITPANQQPKDGGTSSDLKDALIDTFSKADETAAQTKSKYEGVQVSDASGTTGTHTATDASNEPAQTTSNNGLTLQGAAISINLFNAISNAQNWDKLSDLGKLSALSGLHTAAEAAGTDLPGNLSGVTGWLSLAQGVQSGNVVMTTAGVNAVSDQAVDGAVNSALGTSGIPYVSVALALQNFEASPGQSIGTLVGMYFGGPAGAIVGSFIGNAVGGALGLGGSAPPPPSGVATFEWDENGQVQAHGYAGVSGGGAVAEQIAHRVQGVLEQVIQSLNARTSDTSDDVALNPARMPEISYGPEGSFMTVPAAEGAIKLNLNAPDWVSKMTQAMLEGGGLTPAWQVQTMQAHLVDLHAQGASEADIQRELQATQASLLRSAGAGDAAYSVQGNATESADFKTQSYGALVVHLNSDSNVQAAQTQLTQVLKDVDNDGYFESTQSVAARDSAGKLQAVLTLDFNGDGVIETRDVLNLGGNKGQDGNPTTEAQLATQNADLQRNNVAWLDANGDGVLDKNDPAFAAIKLWVDVNQDGVQDSGEAVSLSSQHIASINFKTGTVTYDDGRIDALTAETLKGDTEGVKLTQIQEVNADGTLHTIDAGTVLEHEGYQGKVQVTDEGGTRWADVRNQTYEQEAKRTGDWEDTAEQDAHRHGGGNVAGAPTETTATGATSAGDVKSQPNVTTQRTVTADQVRVTYVPSAAASSAAQEVRSVTASMIRTLEDTSLFGLGALGALSLGGTQAAAMTVQANGVDATVSDAAPLAASPATASTVATANSLLVNATVQTTPNSTSATSHAEQEPTVLLPATVHSTQSAEEAAAPSVLPILTVNATDNGTAWVASAQVATSQVASANAQAALAGLLALQHPDVQGETIDSDEDVVLRIPVGLLLANDSTPNALADPNKPALTVTAVADATHGTVVLDTHGDVVFTPDANYHGAASFRYTVTDQYGLSRDATATLNIAAVNDAPVTQGETASTDEDTGLLFTQAQLLANDSDVDTLTDAQVLSISRVANVTDANGHDLTHGTVTMDANGDIHYLPDANYNGPAQFTYWVSDGAGGEVPATVSITVNPVNDLPVAHGEQVDSDEDVVLRFNPADLLANDSDVDVATNGQVLSIGAIGNAQHGTVEWVTQNDGTRVIQFTPNANYHGAASFDYTVSDGNGGEATATVALTLAAVNDNPVAVGGQEVDSQEDQTLTIQAAGLLQSASDVDIATDGQTLSLSRVAPVTQNGQNMTHGTVSLNANGDVVFTPEANYNGDATFMYWIKDNAGGESQGVTATIHIAAVDDAPSAQGETLMSASEDAVFHIDAATLLANDHDVDNADSELSLAWVGNAQHGTVALDANGNVVFTPDANYNGNATFSYTVKDPDGLTSPAVTATFNIAAVNDAPVAVDDQFTTYNNSTMTVAFNQLTGNDTDADGDALTVSRVRNAEHGSAEIVNDANGLHVQFVPTSNYVGQASFDYLSDDGHGGQSWATAYVDVKAAPNLYPTINITNVDPNWWKGTSEYHEINSVTVSFTINDENPSAVSMNLQWVAYEKGGDTIGWGNYVNSLSLTGGAGTFTLHPFYIFGDKYFNDMTSVWTLTDDKGLQNTMYFNIDRSSQNYSYSFAHDGYYVPPVILDLNGDGTHFTALADSKVAFDMNGDGIADRTAWAGNDDGVLVWDKNHDRTVSDASEFSFQSLKVGAQTDLEGLQALDTNGDGKLDAGDDKFAEFAVWQDANGNGQVDAGEFKSLSERGIASIDLHSDAQVREAGTALAGNTEGQTDATMMGNTHFTRTDGSTGQAVDAMLAYTPGTATPATANDPVTTSEPVSIMTDAMRAEADLIRKVLLLNQMCNTASDNDTPPLGFVPIAEDVSMHDLAAAAAQASAFYSTPHGS